MTARQEVLEAARDLTARGLAPFSPLQLIEELQRRGTRYEESTLRTHIVDIMCVDSPTERVTKYQDLRRVSRGRYVLVAGDRPRREAEHDAAGPHGATEGLASSVPEWHWEGHVQAVFVDHLRDGGWQVVSAADTASRQHGPDVVARRGDQELVVEVKGYPAPSGSSVATQARHYLGGALLTALLAWAERPQAAVGLVLPEVGTYRRLAHRLRAPLEQLELAIWFVHEDGRVEHWLRGRV
jgi:hypothetical protein